MLAETPVPPPAHATLHPLWGRRAAVWVSLPETWVAGVLLVARRVALYLSSAQRLPQPLRARYFGA